MMVTPVLEHIASPRLPKQPEPFRFPLLAMTAPVIAAVAIWLITGSPFALVFAALGPVTAIASYADARLGARRTARREAARFLVDVERARARIIVAHDSERSTLVEQHPPAASILQRAGFDSHRWRANGQVPVLVRVGSGVIRSALKIQADPDSSDQPACARALFDLNSAAAELGGAPVAVDARMGIGVVGPLPFATAIARSCVLQLAWLLSPATHWLGPTVEPWMSVLPHSAGTLPALPTNGWIVSVGELPTLDSSLGDSGAARFAFVAVAAHESQLPAGCAVVISTGGDGTVILQHPDRSRRRPIRAEALSADEAAGAAEVAQFEAARERLTADDGGGLPPVVPFSELVQPENAHGLACAVAIDSTGVQVLLDLVGDGPHAVVGGTTGSGKSELLIAWVLAMAAAHSPEVVNFLLVDFKGGSAFQALAALPHTAGIITDLDEQQAARALSSLRAELHHREREIAAAGARNVEGIQTLPRLVIVIDEFAAMLVDHPDLHVLFADIAARGRSLGVHLILCTQRPAGVVRDSVLANADLRISLRVNNRADSSAVVGTDAAAAIPAAARGRGIIAPAGSGSALVQFAIASELDIGAVAARWPVVTSIRRPWREPLPAQVDIVRSTDLDPSRMIFGASDLPEEQRIGVAEWRPAEHGHLLALGVGGSGKTTFLETIAAVSPRPVWMPRSAEAAWDLMERLHHDLAGGHATTLVIDDLDSLFSRLPLEHRAVFAEWLYALLRDGPGQQICVAMSAQRITSDLQQLAQLAPARLMLAHATRQDFVVAGGEIGQFIPKLPPGGGIWRAHRVQVGVGGPSRPLDTAAGVHVVEAGRPVAIVTTRVAAVLPRLTSRVVIDLAAAGPDLKEALAFAGNSASGAGPVLLGDTDDWQARWGAIAALRQVADILFDGCSLTDYRVLTRSRELPPPLGAASRELPLYWRLNPDGTSSRASLP